jgi:pentatricopeptide repeat protein
MGNPEWEIIPDDVLVPRRTARRHRVVASDVQVFGRQRRTNAADIRPGDARGARTAVSAAEAGPSKKRAHAPSVIHARGEARARAVRDVSCDAPTAAKAGADEPPAHPAARSGVSSEAKKTTSAFSEMPRRVCLRRETPHLEREREPISHGALAAMDEGMARAHKANRKRARDAQTLLRRAVAVRDVKFFNRLIRDFGNDKQLGFAEEAFKRVRECDGLERNVYSHTNMLNACVRVGELEKARRVWENMLAENVEPNEVTYTVFVKGLAQSGCLDEAMELIETLCAEGSTVAPNVRTFSTLLRNCVRHADGVNADRCFEAMRGAGVAPDAASFEYLVKTKCAAFDARGAWAAHAEMEREYLDATPQALAALATVSSITGDVASAEKACVMAKAAIEANGAGVVAPSGPDGARGDSLFSSRMDDDEDRAEIDDAPGPGDFSPTARTSSFGDQNRSDDGTVSESVRAFLRLRNSDAARQVADVEAFLARGDAFVAAVAADVRAGHASASSPVKVVEGEGPVLDFRKLFGGGAGSAKERPPRPVKLEVCSGMGDWVVSRAAADARSANWLAIEMRRNRVRMTWAKGVRARLDNLALLRGMAHEMLSSRVPEDSLSEIYVNYPDPPEWVGSTQCLVDAAFLLEAHRALARGGGVLTLVTDDAGYAMRMCRELSRRPDLFAPAAEDGKPFVSGVPEGYGGSYFDEMWKNGRQTDRYYMRYRAEK